MCVVGGGEDIHNRIVVHGGGIGFFGMLGIVFITLKLMGYIEWSWLWVLAPLWIPLIGALIAGLLCIVIMVVTINKRNRQLARKLAGQHEVGNLCNEPSCGVACSALCDKEVGWRSNKV